MSTHRASELRIAPPYDDDLIRRIEQGFTEKLGFDVQVEVIEDPSLLCGFIAFISGTVYDVSGKAQLVGISQHLVDSVVIPPLAAVEKDGL